MIDSLRTIAVIWGGTVAATRVMAIYDPDRFDVEVNGFTWVDITDIDPPPAVGWTYDGKTFSPPA